jgi:hypothetical protein
MSDLTDSFCERCGTRYAFVADAPKGLSLKGARVLAKGLKNFVLTDGQSISDAIDMARRDDNHEASTRVAEAFHRTFNFCMTCRQYACDRCWNEAAGACLSCSPAPVVETHAAEVRSPAPRPAVAEELPTLQGSTATQEGEWSLFPDAEASAPAADSVAPASFDEPIAISEGRPERPPQTVAPVAWPAVDLAEGQPDAAAHSNGKNGHHSNRKPADPEAASLWPMADEIAPEMTLTPEEMELIETQLSQGQASDQRAPETEAAPVVDAAPQPLFEERATWWNATPAATQDDASTTEWSLDGSTSETVSTPEWEPAAAPSSIEPARQSASAEEPDEERIDEPAALETNLPPVSPRLLRRTSTAAILPPLTPAAPPPQTQEAGGLVARLFGRRAPENEPEASDRPRRASSRNVQPAGDPWPHATAWSERPPEGRRSWLDSAGAPAGSMPEPAVRATGRYTADGLPAAAPEAFSEPAPDMARTDRTRPQARPTARPAQSATLAPQTGPVDIDPRSAAALRLSAVGAAAQLIGSTQAQSAAAYVTPPAAVPAGPVAEDEAAGKSEYLRATTREPLSDERVTEPARRTPPASEPAWIRVQREAAEPEARPVAVPEPEPVAVAQPVAQPVANATRELPDRPVDGPVAASTAVQDQPASDTVAPMPPTPWPPLGASWPTRERRGAPWPGPDATAVPAVVAAKQVHAPTMAEMWVQSAQEVLNRGSVRVCHHCALPVSTQARFCRRCGTQQV